MYERIVSTIIGTPIQRPAQWLRRFSEFPDRWRTPELAELQHQERQVQALYEHFVKRDTNCIDIGAHLGSVTSLIRQLAPAGSHHVVEPIPYKAEWLRRKFPDVTVHQVAVTDHAGSADFFIDPKHSGFSSLRPSGTGTTPLRIPVTLATLDELIPPQLAIGFIKIDVEGAERAAFLGARRILARDRPVVLFECTNSCLKNFGYQCRDLWDALDGYEVFLPKDAISGPALSLGEFEAATHYPFRAFNFVARPRS